MMEHNPSTLGYLRDALTGDAEAVMDQIVAWRREFHQFPELAYEENITASRVAAALDAMPSMEVVRGLGTATSVVGVLRKDIDSPALVLRADMDALAVQEETDLPFASCFPGLMHACGHDSHMASLLGAAKILSARADELDRPVIFLFQPAEEGKGGARKIIEGGLFTSYHVRRMAGLHFWPMTPYGQLKTKKKTLTALSDRIHVVIKGSGAHAASPHLGVDPTIVAAHILLAVQSLLTREMDPMETAVISFGQVEAGEAYNIIPQSAHLWGTLRTFSGEIRDYLQDRLEEMVPLIARGHRAIASVEYTRNYPSLVNDDEVTEDVFALGRSFFGEDLVAEMPRPILSGEDFSFYSLEVPACFMLLGTGSELGLHHPRYDVPEELLPVASAWLAFLGLIL
ncbi:MAG: M20 metallopeptidase family protein [Thermovirgaceae bacterium]